MQRFGPALGGVTAWRCVQIARQGAQELKHWLLCPAARSEAPGRALREARELEDRG